MCRTRKFPVCDVEVGHRSSSVSHLGNIAYHTKQTIEWDGEQELCVNDADAQARHQRVSSAMETTQIEDASQGKAEKARDLAKVFEKKALLVSQFRRK